MIAWPGKARHQLSWAREMRSCYPSILHELHVKFQCADRRAAGI